MLYILAGIWYSQYGISNSIKISSILQFELIRSLREQAIFLILPLKLFLCLWKNYWETFKLFSRTCQLVNSQYSFIRRLMTRACNDTILMKSFTFNLINSMHVVTLVLRGTYFDFFIVNYLKILCHLLHAQ